MPERSASGVELFALADRFRADHWESLNALWSEFEAARDAVFSAAPNPNDEVPEDKRAVYAAALSALKSGMLATPIDVAVEILGKSYRVGGVEASLLGLFTLDQSLGVIELWRILDAFVDGPGIRAARAKKND